MASALPIPVGTWVVVIRPTHLFFLRQGTLVAAEPDGYGVVRASHGKRNRVLLTDLAPVLPLFDERPDD